MKLLIFFLALWVWSDANTVESKASFFRSPIQVVTGFSPAQLYIQRPNQLPDLALVKKNVYTPYRIKKGSESYSGLLAFKPQKGQLEVVGTLIKGNDFARMSLLKGQLTQKEHHYEISFTSTSAQSLFNSKQSYTESTEFPLTLELRTVAGAMPYVTAAFSDLGKAKFEILPITDDTDKKFIGNFKATGTEGNWSFQLSKLGTAQITGVAYLKSENRNCAYSIFGMSRGWDTMTVLTGEDTQQQSNCPLFAWTADPEHGHQWKPLYSQTEEHLQVTREE